MKNTVILLLIALASLECFAQISPPKREVRSITDINMVIETGWTKIEIFPTRRVGITTNSSGIRVMTETETSHAARISAREPVLIFNHVYQQFGYATGEIAFKFKRDKPISMVKSIIPDARAVGNKFFVVNVRTPAEILSVTEQLKARSDVDWVIPTVNYLPLARKARE